MAPNMKRAKFILHAGLFGLTIILTCLLWNFVCVKCSRRLFYMQTVDSAAGGHFIIMLVVFVGSLCSEEFERQTQLALNCVAFIMNLVLVVLLCVDCGDSSCSDARMVCAIAVAVLLMGFHLFEAVYITVRKETREAV